MRAKVIAFLLIAAVLASGAWLLFWRGDTPSPVARIIRDGGLVEEISLDQVEAPYSFVLEDSSGTNTVQVEPGRIRISEADCPDQVCVNRGWIEDGRVPIVCLPHKLMIAIVDGGGELDGGAG